MKRKVYLDHNATTPMRREVREAMEPFLTGPYGNPSSIHTFGQEARKALEKAREQVAAFVGASDSSEIVFTSSGTEADNLALHGATQALKSKGNHIVISSVEHHAVLHPAQTLERQGWKVTYLPVDAAGRVIPESLAKALTDKTVLVSIMHANNELGTIQPIAELAKICRARNVPFHTDAVQTAGKLPFTVDSLGVDMLSLSAHKFYGPKGIGALYVRRGTRIEPLIEGGPHERGYRAGTENVLGIVGMAAACRLIGKEIEKEDKHVRALRDKLESGLKAKIPAIRINGGDPEGRLFNTLNVSFECVEGEGLVIALDLEGIAASTGSACASGTTSPSHVLSAIHLPQSVSQGTVRFSLGRDTNSEDVDYALHTIPKLVERFRSMSPLWEDHQKGITTHYKDVQKRKSA